MTTEPQNSSSADEGARWLEGLAGRATPDADWLEREGARLRQQLAADDGFPAGAPPDLTALIASREASHPPRGWAWAAMLLLACGIGWWQLAPEPERWRGAGAITTVQWIVDGAPAERASPLAADLRRLGAQVQVAAIANGLELRVSAPEHARFAVNDRLAVLEAALDAEGRCTIQVRN